MTKITPRFFVLPIIALAIIAALPRPGAQACAGMAAEAPGCAAAAATVLVR
jgi:hypothetical protein